MSKHQINCSFIKTLNNFHITFKHFLIKWNNCFDNNYEKKTRSNERFYLFLHFISFNKIIWIHCADIVQFLRIDIEIKNKKNNDRKIKISLTKFVMLSTQKFRTFDHAKKRQKNQKLFESVIDDEWKNDVEHNFFFLRKENWVRVSIFQH